MQEKVQPSTSLVADLEMKGLRWFLAAAWAVLSVAVLARFLYDGAALDHNSEITVRFTYEFLALNFPISAPLLYVAPAHPIWQWSFFTLAGFVQWFILIPLLWQWLRRRLSAAKDLG